MKTYLSIIFLLVVVVSSEAQKRYSGHFVHALDWYQITFTREFQENENVFTTIYRISSRENGYYLDVKATHYKNEKKIVVDIDDVTVKGGVHISTQELTYEVPSTEMFGLKGAFKAQFDAQNQLPNKILVQFVSNKFENVKVLEIRKGDQYYNQQKWYRLD